MPVGELMYLIKSIESVELNRIVFTMPYFGAVIFIRTDL